MNRMIAAWCRVIWLAPCLLFAGEPADQAEKLTLAEVYRRVETIHPGLAAYGLQEQVMAALVDQAGRLPNPELEVELEDFGGSFSGLDRAETTVAVSQTVQTAGKRKLRVRVAEGERQLAAWDTRAARLDVALETYVTFYEMLGAQQWVALHDDLFRLAEETHATMQARVEAGKVSPLEAVSAEVALSQARLARTRAETRLHMVRGRLAALWGGDPATEIRVSGDLERVDAMPTLPEVLERLERNPQMARWAQERETSDARLVLEKKRSIPDLDVQAGYRHFRESGENTWVAGVSVPLPFFDRNRGNRRAAVLAVRQVAESEKAVRNRLVAEATESYYRAQAARASLTSLRDQVLPAAKRAFEGAGLGYREGKFAYLDLLEAQRNYFETRAAYTEALVEMHRETAALARLTGQVAVSQPEEDGREHD